MACNGSGCQSNCYKDEEEAESGASCAPSTELTKPGTTATDVIANKLCAKCKVKEAISGYGGVDDGRFCADCFRGNLFGKFRFAVSSTAMISPTDKVLVAFSGGPSSRIKDIHYPQIYSMLMRGGKSQLCFHFVIVLPKRLICFAALTVLQEENPSRECTIVRTAGKLIPFQFNRIPEISDDNVPLATQRREKRYNLKSNESVSSESVCPLCNSPLDKSEIVDLNNLENYRSSDTFCAVCCSSCRFQILPRDPSSMEHFYTDLPQSIVARGKQDRNGNLSMLRKQIQDCLLSDSEDET